MKSEQKIIIFDTTLRDGEQSPGCSMNLEENLKIFEILEHLNVDIVEAGFAIASVVFAGSLTVGVVSMASFNPAVSISLVAVGKLKLTEIILLHIGPQTLGAISATYIYKYLE